MKKLTSFILKYWKSLAFLMLSLFLFTHKFSGGGGSKIPHFDKLAHFGLFLVLTFLVLFDLKKQKPVSVLWIISAVVIYGVSIEIIQAIFLPYRSGSILDIIADTLGTLAGVVAYNMYKNSRLFRPAVYRDI